jgi:hypothetical protein
LDSRHVRLQLHLIRVTFRSEAEQLDPAALTDVRARANEILDRLEASLAPDGHLKDEVAAVRREIN